MWIRPSTFVRRMRSRSALSNVSSVPRTDTPALFTRIPIGVSSLATSSTMRRTSTGSPTSARTARARPPALWISSTTAPASVSLLTKFTHTAAPSRASRPATARPRPREAPVTSAVCPFIVRSVSLQRGEHLRREQLDVLSRERVRHAAELEQPHQNPGAQLLHVGPHLVDDVLGIADEREPVLLGQVEIEIVEVDLLGQLDDRGSRPGVLTEQLHRSLVVAQELAPEVVQVRFGFFTRPRIRLRDVDVAQQVKVLGRRRPSVVSGERAVTLEDLPGPCEGSIRRAGRHPAAGGGLESLVAVRGQDDRRMGLLDRSGPDGDTVVLEVLPAPVEGLAGSPGLDDQIPGLAQTLARIVERAAQREVFLGDPARESRDDAAAGQAIQHRESFGQPNRIVVERGQIAENRDLDATGALTERRRDEIRRRHQPVRFRVVLVDPDRVEPVFLVQDHLVEVLGVHLLSADRIEHRIGVRIMRRRVEVRPRHQVERVDFHLFHHFQVSSWEVLGIRSMIALTSRGPWRSTFITYTSVTTCW